MIIVEEAWKALSTANMADYMKYLFKTVRKYFGEAVVVTQEVDDIISSPIVKETIINNSDCKILLDQRKYMNRFDQIQELLGLTDKEKSQILSINMANNRAASTKRCGLVWAERKSAVYATEVSTEEYLCHTTEETRRFRYSTRQKQLGATLSRLSSCLPMKGRRQYEDTESISPDSRIDDWSHSLSRRHRCLICNFRAGIQVCLPFAKPYVTEVFTDIIHHLATLLPL